MCVERIENEELASFNIGDQVAFAVSSMPTISCVFIFVNTSLNILPTFRMKYDHVSDILEYYASPDHASKIMFMRNRKALIGWTTKTPIKLSTLFTQKTTQQRTITTKISILNIWIRHTRPFFGESTRIYWCWQDRRINRRVLFKMAVSFVTRESKDRQFTLTHL